MVSVCFYFQVHQPYRLKNYRIFDIGKDSNYFDEEKNKEVMRKVAKKCYLPANKLMLELIRKHEGKFRISYSISGTALMQFQEYAPEVLESFQELAKTGCVEFIGETFYHSLSHIFSKEEFHAQINLHKQAIEKLFGQSPKVFRNTELIFNNDLAIDIQNLGYKAVIAEGWDHYLGWRSPNFLYESVSAPGLPLLLKNYKLSDDMAFRFGEKSWKEHPLTAPKYAQWINAVNGNGDVINLFMDYETIGEHQWEDTGIFEFLRHLPEELLKHPDNNFVTVSEAAEKYPITGKLDVHNYMSWADTERDTSAWLGNPLQDSTIAELYAMEGHVKQLNDKKLLNDWRKMTTSDHFYYMCTKWFSDGDVHKYFNPYNSPYEGFIAYMNVLNDLANRVGSSTNDLKTQFATEKPSERIL